ncbi:archaetidylserine decarboxylase [Methylotetracoccus oryzae]|uniref:archaetidylserine decarboxylase n=1 Tax=Methylotetracoccus oryzae TaxID=1919059 RepID=UPI00111947AD|nr:archaetidylserine decarboxylase [Methylotetracoccus oryzae]
MKRLFVLLQYLLPQHALSAAMYRLARWENPLWTRTLIRVFSQAFRVNLNEAEVASPGDFRSFNAFFTRALKYGARPLDATPDGLTSPADGMISQSGRIEDGLILQAKGHRYDVATLLGGDEDGLAELFRDGSFVTIYLSPRDYHRLHMPATGRLRQMIYVPGQLFSVNAATTELVPGLFARNERVVAVFDTDNGPMALVLVGAIFVGSIETVWQGEITPRRSPREIQRWRYAEAMTLEKGAEMGRFNMGSTIVALFGGKNVAWDSDTRSGKSVRCGGRLGLWR